MLQGKKRGILGKIRVASLFLFLAFAVTFTSCMVASAEAPEVIKIGTTVSKSGYMAADSIPSFEGRKLAVKLANKEGGIYLKKYGKKVKVKLIAYDDKSEPSTAVKDFQRLVKKDKVDVLLSAHGSSLSYAVSSAAERGKIPMTIYAGYANKIWNRGYKWIFNVGPTATEYCTVFTQLVGSLGQSVKVGLIHEDGLWAKAVANAMVSNAEELGLDFKIIDIYPADTKDVTPSIDKVLAEGADIIGTVSHVRNDYLVTRTINEMGVKSKFKLIYVQTATGYPSFSKKFKPQQIEGFVGTSVWAPTLDTFGNEEFYREYNKEYGEPPSWVSAIGYAGAQAMLTAIEKAGSLDNEQIRNVFLQEEIPTIIGTLKFREDGTSKGSALVCPQMQNGKPEVVYPLRFATAPLEYPIPAYEE